MNTRPYPPLTSDSPRRGMMTLVNVVAVLLLALIFAFLLNTGKATKRKTEGQHVADAIAYSVGIQKARAMNTIAATNHVMGEMLAMIAVHHALGGDLLDLGQLAEGHSKQAPRLNRLNSNLDAVRQHARSLGAKTPAYGTVRQRSGIKAERTLLRAKMNLKSMLIRIYRAKIAARLMQLYPPTRSAGRALERAMDGFEQKLLAEYRVLNQFQALAEGLLPVKFQWRDERLPEAKQFTEEIVLQTPQIVRETADELARKYAVANAYIVDPTLPVVLDPLSKADTVPNIPALPEKHPRQCCDCRSTRTAVTRPQIAKVTQLERAMAPWVFYHRHPVWESLAALAPLSQAGEIYLEETAGAARDLGDRYQRDEHDLGLFVLRGYPAPDKGYETWTQDRVQADALLCTMAVVYLPPDRVIGAPAVYQQHHPRGQIFYAQSLIYNSNPQERHPHRIDLTCKRITPNRQANVGYDTLNWHARPGVDAMGLPRVPWELVAKTDLGGQPDPEFPKIRLNWQAKMVPSSAEQLVRLKASSSVPPVMRPLVEKLLDQVPGALLAH